VTVGGSGIASVFGKSGIGTARPDPRPFLPHKLPRIVGKVAGDIRPEVQHGDVEKCNDFETTERNGFDALREPRLSGKLRGLPW
jgi:hypothetical protein